jgi:general secretion pathway protein I
MKSKDAGFTILEVLIAFAILGVALAAVLGGVGGGLNAALRADGLVKATMAAQSLLAGAGLDIPLRPGRQSGALPDGSGWSLEVQPGPDGMLLVTASVDAPGAGGRVRLVTLRPP